MHLKVLNDFVYWFYWLFIFKIDYCKLKIYFEIFYTLKCNFNPLKKQFFSDLSYYSSKILFNYACITLKIMFLCSISILNYMVRWIIKIRCRLSSKKASRGLGRGVYHENEPKIRKMIFGNLDAFEWLKWLHVLFLMIVCLQYRLMQVKNLFWNILHSEM